MNNREKKEVALVASGIILGAALAAPVAGAALTAQQSSQKIVVDGKPVQIEAYSIGGNSYCKLRDVGKAVGFHVSYDVLTNTVRINTNEAYEDETAASGTVKLPTDGSQYIPQVGDRILCNDGTEYEIKDVSRWDNNVYQWRPSKQSSRRSMKPTPRSSGRGTRATSPISYAAAPTAGTIT